MNTRLFFTLIFTYSVNNIAMEQNTERRALFFASIEEIPHLIEQGASLAEQDAKGNSALAYMLKKKKLSEAGCALYYSDEATVQNALASIKDIFNDLYNSTELSLEDEFKCNAILYSTSDLQKGVFHAKTLTKFDWINLFKILESYYPHNVEK